MRLEKDFLYESKQEMTNGTPWSLSKFWDCLIHQYGLPLLHYCISILYAIYTNCTAFNVVLFVVKIVPTGVYVTNLVKNIYVTSRERMRQNQIEIEDLQLQIRILNTKLSVRDAEFMERKEELRKGAERLRTVRAKVREVIAADEGLRHSLQESVPWEDVTDTHLNSPPEEREFILQLLKELKYDQEEDGGCGRAAPSEMSCGERAPSEPPREESVYSSASDAEVKQNCRVKIVKVTNVYKVAYLKHFIKQKKIRRATKHAILKKKVETVKQFLEDWQKTLDMVINSKCAILNMESKYLEAASQEAMGDYTKQDMRDFSDTDSEIRNLNDSYYEQPILSWTQNPHSNFTSSFEDVPDAAVSRETREPQYGKYPRDGSQLEGSLCTTNRLSVVAEETVSQMAIEEVRSEASDEYECRVDAHI